MAVALSRPVAVMDSGRFLAAGADSYPGGKLVSTELPHGGVWRPYWTVRLTGGLETPPTVTTTGCAPGGTVAGTVKLTCVSPNTVVESAVVCRNAGTPPTVTVIGRNGRYVLVGR